MSTTQQSHPQSPHTTDSADQSTQLPALIEKAVTDIAAFLKEGAHVLCPVNVTDPVPGYFPRVVAIKINPNPEAGEVYVKEWDYSTKPRTPKLLELTKNGLQRLADMIGLSWDPLLSRRIDDGRVPDLCVFLKVAKYRDYYGEEHILAKTKTLDLRTIKTVLIIEYEDKCKAYRKKLDTKYKDDVPTDWKQAYDNNAIAEWIYDKVRRDLAKKAQFLPELAETGAMLAVIRSKGIRTSYSPQELSKAFVDIRTIPLPGTQTRQKAEQANSELYGSGPPPRVTPSEQTDVKEVLDACYAHCVEDETGDATSSARDLSGFHDVGKTDVDPASSQQSAASIDKPSKMDSNIADFQAADQEQRIALLKTLSSRKQFPLPKNFEQWGLDRAIPFYKMLLELSDPSHSPQQTGMFEKGGA